MNIIEATNTGNAWHQAYELVMKKGSSVKDGEISLKEVLDVFLIVQSINGRDNILEKYADKEMIKWMVEENFGGQKPVLDWGYSYGMRFRDFNGVDQISLIIDKLKSNPESKSATISLMNPSIDYRGHMPCIVALDFKIRNDKLLITGFFRSQDIGKKIYADILALGKIQSEVASALSTTTGEIKIFISSAHIYEQDFGKFQS